MPLVQLHTWLLYRYDTQCKYQRSHLSVTTICLYWYIRYTLVYEELRNVNTPWHWLMFYRNREKIYLQQSLKCTVDFFLWRLLCFVGEWPQKYNTVVLILHSATGIFMYSCWSVYSSDLKIILLLMKNLRLGNKAVNKSKPLEDFSYCTTQGL